MTKPTKTQEEIYKEAKFLAISGSFDLPESSDELIKIIKESNITKDLEKIPIPF